MYPERRMRRLRKKVLQPLFRETTLRIENFVAPVFIDETIFEPLPISSMPGQYRWPLSMAGEVAVRLHNSGIMALILFGIPSEKDAEGKSAFAEEGVIQKAVRTIKKTVPEMVVITDVCACEYTDHGHCGIIGETCYGPDLLNDPSVSLMTKIAVSHAYAGADMVAPSCMLDGMVGAIRNTLDSEGFSDLPVMSYSTKFSSALYGPFRDAADSGYSFGDRSTYQISPSNGREALLESKLDFEEGADVLMVKPAGIYLDVVAEVARIGIPVAAFQVSGEYAMIKAAAEKGWLNEKEVVMESLHSIRRAGASLIITYFAEDVAGWLNEE